MHPVLESLRGTDRQWLIDTLYAFNSGHVERFQTLRTAWGQQVSHRQAGKCPTGLLALSGYLSVLCSPACPRRGTGCGDGLACTHGAAGDEAGGSLSSQCCGRCWRECMCFLVALLLFICCVKVQVTNVLPPLQPDLAANEAQLLRKIQLLCLMEVSDHWGRP